MMNPGWLGSVAALSVGLCAAVACGGDVEDTASCLEGTEGCPCFRNNTCDEGLICEDEVCVAGASAGSAGTSATGGGPGDTGGSAGRRVSGDTAGTAGAVGEGDAGDDATARTPAAVGEGGAGDDATAGAPAAVGEGGAGDDATAEAPAGATGGGGDIGGQPANGGSGVSGGGSSQPVEGTPAPDDFPDYTKGPYGYCEPAEVVPRMYCPENRAGGGGSDDCLEWCNCRVSCDSDADCPAPETGDSEPFCEDGECILPCADGVECPEGMTCLEMRNGREECTWAVEGEANLGCWLDMNPDYCEQFTSKEACQERMLTDPLRPDLGCIWLVETIHSTASESCEPAGITESCVPGMRGECDREGLACPGSESWVHFRDIGAGTAALMVTDSCFIPGGIWFGEQPDDACSFGDPSLPLLCDCACE